MTIVSGWENEAKILVKLNSIPFSPTQLASCRPIPNRHRHANAHFIENWTFVRRKLELRIGFVSFPDAPPKYIIRNAKFWKHLIRCAVTRKRARVREKAYNAADTLDYKQFASIEYEHQSSVHNLAFVVHLSDARPVIKRNATSHTAISASSLSTLYIAIVLSPCMHAPNTFRSAESGCCCWLLAAFWLCHTTRNTTDMCV